MYHVDSHDRVVELSDFPQCSIGAPLPSVISTEHETVLLFLLDDVSEDWDGTSTRIVSLSSADEPLAMVTFHKCYAHMFGPPNEEAYMGHPLAGRGFRPFGAFRIENSSWLRRVESMNSAHRNHSPARFAALTHFIATFHDSTFECIASSYTVEVMQAPPKQALLRIVERMVP